MAQLIPCVWLGLERVGTERTRSRRCLDGDEEGWLAPEENIPPRCGLELTPKIWRTERLHPGSLASASPVSLSVFSYVGLNSPHRWRGARLGRRRGARPSPRPSSPSPTARTSPRPAARSTPHRRSPSARPRIGSDSRNSRKRIGWREKKRKRKGYR